MVKLEEAKQTSSTTATAVAATEGIWQRAGNIMPEKQRERVQVSFSFSISFDAFRLLLKFAPTTTPTATKYTTTTPTTTTTTMSTTNDCCLADELFRWHEMVLHGA